MLRVGRYGVTCYGVTALRVTALQRYALRSLKKLSLSCAWAYHHRRRLQRGADAAADIPREVLRVLAVVEPVQVGAVAIEIPPGAVSPRGAVVAAVVGVPRAECQAEAVRHTVGCKRALRLLFCLFFLICDSCFVVCLGNCVSDNN